MKLLLPPSITSITQALTESLFLGLIADTDEGSAQAIELAEWCAARMPFHEVEACKAAALEMAQGLIGSVEVSA